MDYPTTTCWGDPASEKRALLLHGLSSASPSWFRVAELLTARGFYVVAPDLIGHGLGPSPGATCTVATLTSALLPLFAAPALPWGLLIGHSLGGVIALHLPPVPRIVLVDPPLELSANQTRGVVEGTLDDFKNLKSVEEFMKRNPRWTERDAVIKVYGESVCDPAAVEALFRDTVPWSFTHLLPAASTETEVIILGAEDDPAFTPAEATALASTRPDVVISVVKDTSHSIHREDPEEVVRWALEGKTLTTTARGNVAM